MTTYRLDDIQGVLVFNGLADVVRNGEPGKVVVDDSWDAGVMHNYLRLANPAYVEGDPLPKTKITLPRGAYLQTQEAIPGEPA